MYLAESKRRKDGKDHRYYRIVEKRRGRGGHYAQRTLLYLGEINDSQKAAWTRSIDVVMDRERRQIALFPEDRKIPEGIENSVHLRMSKLELRHPRQWGACWLATYLWEMLELDEFWRDHLPASRKGTEWAHVLEPQGRVPGETLVSYRLIEPGSEWRLHRYWYEHSAIGDLLGEGFEVAAKNTL
jgi:hypothetical protein